MVCPNCQTPNEPGAIFCVGCSKRLPLKNQISKSKVNLITIGFIFGILSSICLVGFVVSFFLRNIVLFYLLFGISFMGSFLGILFGSIQSKYEYRTPGRIGFLRLKQAMGKSVALTIYGIIQMMFLIMGMIVFQVLLMVL